MFLKNFSFKKDKNKLKYASLKKKSQILIFIKMNPEFKNMFWKMEK